MGLKKSLRGFDIYHQLPTEHTDGSCVGASLSIFCALLVGGLIMNEFTTFLTPTEEEAFGIDDKYTDLRTSMYFHLDASLFNLPCAFVQIPRDDSSSIKEVQLRRRRIYASGESKMDIMGGSLAAETRTYDTNAEVPMDSGALRDLRGEGCRITATITVAKGPGSLNIQPVKTSPEIRQMVVGSKKPFVMNHEVHSLIISHEESKTESSERAITNIKYSSKKTASFSYYLKMIPYITTHLSGVTTEGFHYTVDSNQNTAIPKHQIPAITLNYDISPIKVSRTWSSHSGTHFIVQMCAIIGGVYTSLGMVKRFLAWVLRVLCGLK